MSSCDCVISKNDWDKKGYPRITVDGKKVFLHGEVYRRTRGAIPLNMCVCHRCDTPSCINPDHLFLGTITENNKDRDLKGRQAAGDRHGRTVIPNAMLPYVRHMHAQGVSVIAIARAYGAGNATVSRIVTGRERRC